MSSDKTNDIILLLLFNPEIFILRLLSLNFLLESEYTYIYYIMIFFSNQ